jgi:hypothetical protein
MDVQLQVGFQVTGMELNVDYVQVSTYSKIVLEYSTPT